MITSTLLVLEIAEKKDEEKSEDKTVEKESASGKESKAVEDKKAEEPASSAWVFLIHILYLAIWQG